MSILAHSAGCLVASYALKRIQGAMFGDICLAASIVEQGEQARLLAKMGFTRKNALILASAKDWAMLGAQFIESWPK